MIWLGTDLAFHEIAMKRPRVVPADDHRLLREAFTRLFEPRGEIAGAVGDGRALLAPPESCSPSLSCSTCECLIL